MRTPLVHALGPLRFFHQPFDGTHGSAEALAGPIAIGATRWNTSVAGIEDAGRAVVMCLWNRGVRIEHVDERAAQAPRHGLRLGSFGITWSNANLFYLRQSDTPSPRFYIPSPPSFVKRRIADANATLDSLELLVERTEKLVKDAHTASERARWMLLSVRANVEEVKSLTLEMPDEPQMSTAADDTSPENVFPNDT